MLILIICVSAIILSWWLIPNARRREIREVPSVRISETDNGCHMTDVSAEQADKDTKRLFYVRCRDGNIRYAVADRRSDISSDNLNDSRRELELSIRRKGYDFDRFVRDENGYITEWVFKRNKS